MSENDEKVQEEAVSEEPETSNFSGEEEVKPKAKPHHKPVAKADEPKLTPAERRANDVVRYNAMFSQVVKGESPYETLQAFRDALEDEGLVHLLDPAHESLVSQYLLMPKRA